VVDLLKSVNNRAIGGRCAADFNKGPKASKSDATCKSLETKQTMGVCNETPGPS
jgi:hypothetical protein